MFETVSTTELSFNLGDEIGHDGKNSKVYRATDLQLNAEIVVKQVPKSDFSDLAEYFTEARLLHQSSHPNVVPIYYGCQDDDHIYISMPYFKNGSLKNRLGQGPLTVREIVVFATQILSGLHNIHSKGLIHFDLKPDNILFSDRGEPLIADFGLAKMKSYSGYAGQDRLYGKMVPPESFSTDNFNNQFDLYQIGLTIHRMCVGDVAFYNEYNRFVDSGVLDRAGFRHAVVNGQFPSTQQYPENITQKLIDIVRKCLSRNLGNRYGSAIQIVNALSEIDGNLLDWKMDLVNNETRWAKTDEKGREFLLILSSDGSSLATKTSAAGNTQRIVKYCKGEIQRSEIKRFLREF